ncbi:hypothetical protein PspLS_00496 [Pyricularia sp. CBS 133598]|nr:hypothetical protein PspLS_00496 [Pyricularia sp. CBS 133598]
MTSPASTQDQNPAQNPSASSATSYASAAGAAKKPSSTPLSAQGSNPPPVVVGSSAPGNPQHGNKPAASPVNGRPAITPAIPAVAGATNGHDRKTSVTISANGGPVGGPKGNIQFGYKESPGIVHSTPQQGTTAPIPIPGNNARVPSPAHSPSPIPQPSASGGRPPSMMAQDGGPSMKFGSLGGDGERHMKHLSQGPHNMGSGSPHMRHGSTHSVHDNMPSHGGPGAGRGGNFASSGGRGRGGYNNQAGYNNPMGYPPTGQYGRGGAHAGQGRGGMPYQQNQRGMAPYPNSPQPRGSPAMGNAMPNPGTPTMNASLPVHPPQQGYNAYMPPAYPNVNATPQFQRQGSKPVGKKKGARRDSVKAGTQFPWQNSDTSQDHPSGRCRRQGTHWDSAFELSNQPISPKVLSEISPPTIPLADAGHKINLSPASGNFDRLLTIKKQTYGFAPPFDPRQQGMMGMGYQYPMGPNMPPYGMPPQGPSPSPGFSQQQSYPPGPFTPQAQPMSRNASQVSERPNSSTGHQQAPANPQGPPPHHTPTAKPAVVSSGSSSFVIPKKTTAKITIKNAAGEAVDFKALKPPASPAPSSQQAKTPPVTSSTPTPPPKSATPSHTRSDSASNLKTAEQKRSEFMEQVRKTAAGDSKEPAAEEAAEKATDKASADAATETPEPPAPVEEVKAAEANEESKATPVEEQQKVEAADAQGEKPAGGKVEEVTETEEERFEREIREMEEREAEEERRQAEYDAKKKAQAEAKKAQEEKDRAKNAAENDRKLREQEAEMERLEEEKERKRAEAEAAGKAESVADMLAGKTSKPPAKAAGSISSVTDKLASLSVKDGASGKSGNSEKTKSKPAALNLAPLNTKPVEPPQPSAALQSLKSARFLEVIAPSLYPAGIHSPNPALNSAVSKKGKSFKYDANFLLQFQKVFTEQPSMEFGQQVKSLIGDGDRTGSARTPASSRQTSGRGAAGPSGGFPGGSFMNPGKPGSAFGNMGPPARGGGSMGPIGSFQRPFPGGTGMTRNPSQSGMQIPGSPRQASRRTGSKRNDYSNAKQEAQAAKTMPLTAGMELKPIATTASGWKPMSLTKGAPQAAGLGTHMEPEIVQRKVKAALNKMTPEKFDKIADQILEIAAQSKDEQDGRTLRQVIQLTFEKATDEAHWASMYAKFCKRMLETMSAEIRDISIKDKHGNVVSGGALFRKYLLNRCQEEFERGWKMDLPEPKEGDEKKTGEAAMLSDEYYIAAAAKRRGLGLVQFIGELYKLGMLTERIMHQCVQKLVDYSGIPDEAEVESLCKLLRTIGANLDQNADKTQGRAMMDAYFDRINTMINLPDLPSRLQFMLMDVVDLRRGGWVSKEANKGPKTLDEVRAEAEAAAAQKAAENARTNQRGGPRPPMGGRGSDMRGLSGYGQPQQNQNQVGMDDLRRLKGSAMRTSSQNATFGPTSMFASRSNSGRARLGAGGPFGRAGEESGASSRTATPPTRESMTNANTFSLLANMETENPTSPPAVSPALTKATPDSGDKDKK